MIPTVWTQAKRLLKCILMNLCGVGIMICPKATAFPNDIEEGYKGMLVVRSELTKYVFTSSSDC